jgi:hypothetical protein
VKRLPTVLVLVVAMAPAQLVQLGTCVAFNDTPTFTPAPVSLCNSTGWVSFVAPASFTVTEVEVYGDAYLGIQVSVMTGSLSTSAMLLTGMQTPPPIRWLTIPISPFAISAGSICTVTFTPLLNYPSGSNPLTVYANPAGSSLLSLTRTCATNQPCNAALPCQTPGLPVPLMLRLRGGSGCVGGSPAVINTVGGPCGSGGPLLFPNGFPMVGDSGYVMSLNNGPALGTVGLFLAQGLAAPPTPVEPGHPCAVRLQPASFAYLNSIGYEPLLVTTPGPGTTAFAVPIPPMPQLIGLQITFQVGISTPLGIPLFSVPGVSIMVTNALELTLGG